MKNILNLFKKNKCYYGKTYGCATWEKSDRQHEIVVVKGLTVDGIKNPQCVVIGKLKNFHIVSYQSGGFGMFNEEDIIKV
jgi:hypothetical protein